GNLSRNGNRSILGSYLECDLEAINSGESYILNLTVHNASDDNEWIRDINIDFPEGMEVTTATNFTGGSLGDLVYDGTTGYGVSVNWHGEDPNGWGVIKGSETAVAQVTIFLDPDYQDNAILSFEVIGDIYGNEPHIITGDVQIINLGPELEWISIDSTNGAITAQTSLDNLIHFNTEGMDDGEYVCEIIINEQFQRQTIIPVFLIVDQYLSVSALILDESGFLKAFPNPFITGSKIMFDIPVSGYLNLCVHDLKGKLIRTLIDNSYLSTGQYQLMWDGKDNNGTDLPDGIYLVTLRTEKRTIVEKLIKLK
ncbi:MAG: T9SS type A sorting domain-containing protein, partial [Bacteroidetes bacterium]|nr:T9SS type A sorting domain-containing protein [Bacteroidota bacterium]